MKLQKFYELPGSSQEAPHAILVVNADAPSCREFTVKLGDAQKTFFSIPKCFPNTEAILDFHLRRTLY